MERLPMNELIAWKTAREENRSCCAVRDKRENLAS